MDLFSDLEVNLILSLPISHRLPEDKLIWHFKKKGLFSVKSTCHVALDVIMGISNRASPSTESQASLLWKKIWEAKVPPKVRINAWHFCLDIIQYKANLAK